MDKEPKQIRSLDEVKEEMGIPKVTPASRWEKIKSFPGSEDSLYLLLGASCALMLMRVFS